MIRHGTPAALVILAIAAGLFAQQQAPTAGEKTRANSGSQSYNLPGGYPGEHHELLKTVKVRAVVLSIDLDERIAKVAPEAGSRPFKIAVATGQGPLEWGTADEIDLLFFGQPEGMEKIMVSKKLAKRIGKKSLRLEDVEVGATLKAEIYPVRRPDSYRVASHEVTVEEPGK